MSIDMSNNVPSKRTQAKGEKGLLETLFALGGGQVTESDVVYHDEGQIKLPRSVSKRNAIKVIQKSIEDEETYKDYTQPFDYRPWDGAYCMHQALLKAFGTAGFAQAQVSMFGVQRPAEIQVKVGKSADGRDITASVPWGTFEFPILQATITTGATMDPERGPLFQMTVSAPKKHSSHVAGLFKLVENEMRTNSIYRSKAFDGATEPSFINPWVVDRHQVVYTDAVNAALEANVWAMLKHTDKFAQRGLPLKRCVLLEGPYGTGKTLAAYLTAQVATDNGWAFIQCRPGVDDLNTVLQTAKLYQPCVVFYEDIDTLANPGDEKTLSKLLEMFDGLSAKGTKLLMVLTTNHPEHIHEAMQRPGRVDARIRIAALDSGARERLIKAKVPAHLLDPDIDYDRIDSAMQGYLPAFITEAIDRAQRYSFARLNGEDGMLTTDDFVFAAEDVRPQFEAMEAASGLPQVPQLNTALQTVVGDIVVQTLDRTKLIQSNGAHRLSVEQK